MIWQAWQPEGDWGKQTKRLRPEWRSRWTSTHSVQVISRRTGTMSPRHVQSQQSVRWTDVSARLLHVQPLWSRIVAAAWLRPCFCCPPLDSFWSPGSFYATQQILWALETPPNTIENLIPATRIRLKGSNNTSAGHWRGWWLTGGSQSS